MAVETSTSFVLTAKQRAALNACYRLLLSLSARRKEAADGETLAVEPSADSDPGDSPEQG